MTLAQKFEELRDLPYTISLDYHISSADCATKDILLYKWCQIHAIPVRYRVCTFSWNTLPFPAEIIQKEHEIISLHVYLEVWYDNAWIDIDATWDKNLHRVLPVNIWDNYSQNNISMSICC